MTDGLRAGLAAPTTPVNVSHAFIRRVTHAIHTDTHPFHIAAGEERALIDNPYPALRDLSLLVLNVGFHLKLSPPPPQHESHRRRVESNRQAPTVVRNRPVLPEPYRTVGGVS